VTCKGVVLAGAGAVSQNVTCNKPVTNPTSEWIQEDMNVVMMCNVIEQLLAALVQFNFPHEIALQLLQGNM